MTPAVTAMALIRLASVEMSIASSFLNSELDGEEFFHGSTGLAAAFELGYKLSRSGR